MKSWLAASVIISALFMPCAHAVEAKLADTGALVRGTCTIELKIGTRQYLSKMGIAVAPADAETELAQVRNDQWRLRASRANYNDGFHYLDLDAIGGVAVARAVRTVQTDLEGRYQIRGLAPGNYLLYAQYRSRYAVAYWLVPLTVKTDTDDLVVDINNSNMKEVFNLKKSQW